MFQNYNALWNLSVSVLLSALAFFGGTPSDSLMVLATVCALAKLVGNIMFGSAMLNGNMTNASHLLAMIYSFGTFMALFYATAMVGNDDEKPAIKATVPKVQSGGSSVKGYLFVVASYLVLWAFLNSDGSVCTEVILREEDFSPLAVAAWNWWSVGKHKVPGLLHLFLFFLANQQTCLGSCYRLCGDCSDFVFCCPGGPCQGKSLQTVDLRCSGLLTGAFGCCDPVAQTYYHFRYPPQSNNVLYSHAHHWCLDDQQRCQQGESFVGVCLSVNVRNCAREFL